MKKYILCIISLIIVIFCVYNLEPGGSFLATLLGGLIGGAGSYLGGIWGANRNYRLSIKKQEHEAYKHIYAILKNSIDIFKDWEHQHTKDPVIMIFSRLFIFDKNWLEDLIYVDLSIEDKKMIYIWASICESYKIDKDGKIIPDITWTAFENLKHTMWPYDKILPKIEAIANKLKNKIESDNRPYDF